MHQADGEVALTGGFVVGSGLTDKHASEATIKTVARTGLFIIMAQQFNKKAVILLKSMRYDFFVGFLGDVC